MLMDNGSPWGDDAQSPDTILTAWLIRLGIQICHGRPYHPQTQGKDERLDRTLKSELLSRHTMTNLPTCQSLFGMGTKIMTERSPETLWGFCWRWGRGGWRRIRRCWCFCDRRY